MREIRDLKRKMILLLGIKLIFAGTFATAQDYDMLKRHKPKFEHSGFEKPDLLVNKKTKSEQEWWEPDTVWIFRADSEEFFGRVFFESNSQGLKTLELYQTRQNNIWENKKQWIYSYDTNNNLISRLDLDWQDDDWKNKTQKTCTYDIKNNLITELYQEWHNESWVNTKKSNFWLKKSLKCYFF